MNPVTKSIGAFGIYLILVPGLGLILIPELILDLLSLGYGENLWLPRMIGLCACVIGTLDLGIAYYELEEMGKLSVVIRYSAAAFMVGLWAIGDVGVMIFLFAALDFLGATWTLLAIRHTASHPNEGTTL